MEFPKEIWLLIMGHFHSSYRKPPHSKALMRMTDFYYTCGQHRACMTWNRSLMVDTYYMRSVLSSDRNSTASHGCRLNRGVATGKVAEEFGEIFEAYRSGDHLDRRLVYKV